MSNEFPWIWHETFSHEVDPAWTAAEVAFLARVLPPGRVLDVACGFGRHALGVGRDPRVAAAAREAGDRRRRARRAGWPGGVLVLDVWNPAGQREGERTIRGGVRERKTIAGGRMRTELAYPDGSTDVHDFRLYEPDELAEIGARHGLERVLVCTWCDESRSPSADDARYQLVLVRG